MIVSELVSGILNRNILGPLDDSPPGECQAHRKTPVISRRPPREGPLSDRSSTANSG